MSCIAIDPGDLEAEKKKDEELERMKQLQIELNQQEAEKRDKEVVEARLKALCPEWNVN